MTVVRSNISSSQERRQHACSNDLHIDDSSEKRRPEKTELSENTTALPPDNGTFQCPLVLSPDNRLRKETKPVTSLRSQTLIALLDRDGRGRVSRPSDE